MGKTIAFPTNDNKITGYPHAKEWSWVPTWNYISNVLKMNLKCEGKSYNYKTLARKWNEVAQSCQTLCDPMDCSLPGSTIRGIF